jgi:cobalt-zinc-cadmium efflux system protein
MSTTETALTAPNLVRSTLGPADDVLHDAAHELDIRFGIRHATLQLETGDGAQVCRLAPEEVV